MLPTIRMHIYWNVRFKRTQGAVPNSGNAIPARNRILFAFRNKIFTGTVSSLQYVQELQEECMVESRLVEWKRNIIL